VPPSAVPPSDVPPSLAPELLPLPLPDVLPLVLPEVLPLPLVDPLPLLAPELLPLDPKPPLLPPELPISRSAQPLGRCGSTSTIMTPRPSTAGHSSDCCRRRQARALHAARAEETKTRVDRRHRV
jgi:hypothetical protein